MSDGLVIASEADLKRVLENVPKPKPGEECLVCHRLAPKVRSDAQPGPRREVMSIHIPKGEPPLEPMLISLVDRYKEQWPLDHAAMERTVGLEIVGGRSWKYYSVHFAVYACLMVPGLGPTEEG